MMNSWPLFIAAAICIFIFAGVRKR
jgi:hypothetical protein